MNGNSRKFYEFDSFQLDPAERRLRRGPEVVSLTPKAFDVLLMLVANSGHALKKEEFLEKVWNGSFVEEKNLADNISTLRKLLRDDPKHPKFIETVPRHGYRFVADVREVRENADNLLVAERSRTHIVVEEDDRAESPVQSSATFPANRALASTAAPRRQLIAVGALVTLTGVSAVALAAAFAWKALTPAPKSEPRIRTPTITLVTNSGADIAATISPDGKFIAYAQNYISGTGNLYLRQTGSNNQIALLTAGERIFGTIAFSPDSNRLYYIAYDQTDPRGFLYEIPVLGGPPRRLFPIERMFGLSPDGKQVAFFRDVEPGRRHLVIANLDESGEQMVPQRTGLLLGGCPAWSPDGKRLAVLANYGGKVPYNRLVAVDVSTGNIEQLTADEWIDAGKMIWRPNTLVFVGNHSRLGQQLFYMAEPDRQVHQITGGLSRFGNYGLGVSADGETLVADSYSTSAQLWSLPTYGDATLAVRLTTGLNDGGVGLAALSDGRIVYVARVGGVRDLWIINGDGSDPRPLTADELSEGEVTATPDGRTIIFSAERWGESHLYRLEVDAGQVRQLTAGSAYDEAPDCSPDGQWIIYSSMVNGRRLIRKISVEGGEPSDLLEGAVGAAYSPDGRMISCILTSDSVVRPSRLVIMPATGGAPTKSFDIVSFSWWYPKTAWTPEGEAVVYRQMEAQKGGLWNLWQQPVAGGNSKRLTNFTTETVFRYAFTRDGKRLVVSRGSWVNDVAMITNFR